MDRGGRTVEGSIQADCFACAALDSTSTPNIDPNDLAQALGDEELTQAGPWPW